MRTHSVIVFLTLSLVACGEPQVPPVFSDPTPFTSPGLSMAEGPRLSSGVDGNPILSWMQRLDEGGELFYSRFDGGSWGPANLVVTDAAMFVNWADAPSVTALSANHWIAHWLSKRAPATYAYDVKLTQSTDEGRNWSPPVLPHNDATPTEHGFVSVLADDGGARLIWLDGRKMLNEPGDDPLETSMTLRSAVVSADDSLHSEQEIDDMVCECCDTDMTIGSSGPIAVYRNRTTEETRDIYVTRLVDGDWSPGKAVSDDNWLIPGCPVNGPAIAAAGDHVAVAWFTAANDQPLVKLKTSDDGGRTFGDPIVVVQVNAIGQVDIEFIDDTSVAVSWIHSGQRRDLNDVKVVGVTTDGQIGNAVVIGRTAYVRAVPQMTRLDDRLIVAWIDTDAEGDTRLASAYVTIQP